MKRLASREFLEIPKMSHPYPITERREVSRSDVDLPATVQCGSNPRKSGKVVDLSIKGAAILYSEPLEIDSKLELRFTIPTESISPEIRIGACVRHIYKISSTPDTPSEYQYAVGAEFLNIDPHARILLAEFLR
ncbi:MAG TPA: PilZ domain-containing protein [Gallionella sp.]|nr:PilZ domain-containing protein [Gallionella sp.]